MDLGDDLFFYLDDDTLGDSNILTGAPVTTLTGQSRALANEINWNPDNDLTFISTAKIIDISKSVLGETNFGEDTIIASNILLSQNSFFDYDVDMRKDYRYTLKIDDQLFNSSGIFVNPSYFGARSSEPLQISMPRRRQG